MKTVGQLLRSERRKQGMSRSEVAKATRIRVQYLRALEEDEYGLLPSATYAKGFIKNYAEYLHLPTETLLAVFRRDFSETERGEILPRSMVETQKSQRVLWSPKLTRAVLVFMFVSMFVGFLGYQSMSLLRPRLEVDVPQNNEVVMAPNVRIAGRTDPDVVLEVNDQLAVVQADGTFEIILQMQPGQTTLSISATNRRNYQTVVERTILVKAEE